ncbi:hypothetical protein [Marinicella meishanensis]|uniref:hypothetical protein n=1 Tax=Marinicella meishanensis TaxID=2873263 RepID=UPI001CC00C91|nr:hypothetical protein [Marinicella sp. NBU2979]
MGADAACDFQIGTLSLQDAVDADPTEIRLASNTTYAPVSIRGATFLSTVIGGFANCTDAANNIISADRSIIAGTNNDAVMLIEDTSINLANIQFTNGLIGLEVNLINTSAEIFVDNVITNFNEQGILLENASGAPGLYFFAEDLKSHNNINTTRFGNGLQCIGTGNGVGNTEAVVVGDSGFYNNTSALGGGVSLENCRMLLVGGDHTDSTVGIRNNTGQQGGGGIVVLGSDATFVGIGSTQTIGGITYGNNLGPLIISGNQANVTGARFGGGILIGASASVQMSAVALFANQARRGGGIYSSVNTQLSIFKPTNCWSAINCNFIGLNESTEAGGGLFAINEAKVEIGHTRFSQNRALRGVAALINGQNTEFYLETVLIDQNGDAGQNGFSDDTILTIENNAQLEAKFITVIDNNSVNEVIQSNNASLLSLEASYLYNPNGGPFLTILGNDTSSLSCLILDDSNNLPTDGFLMSDTQYSNAFVNPAAGDYRTLPGALGIDYCQPPTMPLLTDVNDHFRGYDDPNVVNQNSSQFNVYDIGFHENYSSDIIFEDGFEPINTD